MSARGTQEHAGTSRCSAIEETENKTGRRAPRTPRVVVTNPRISVLESQEPADRAALDAAIRLFVKWATRAHELANPAATEAPEGPTDHKSAA